MPARRTRMLGGAAVLLALAACNAPDARDNPPLPLPGGTRTDSGGTPPGPPETGPAPPGTAGTVLADEHLNGRTVAVAVGQRLELDLHSTYWVVAGSQEPALLSQDGPTRTTVPAPGSCLPGAGCGLLRTTFTALRPGTATLTASRTSCGEALRCTGDQGSYRLTVTIGG
jgi:hypothetical protein